MVNYQNGKIYKLVSDKTDKIYIGSTCNTLSRRHSGHKSDYKCFIKKINKNYVSSFELMKLGQTDIILIEDFPCERKEQLHARERHFIESLNCVNKCIPGRTDKEYRENNKEKIKEYRDNNKEKIKEYQQKNKEKINEQRKERYNQNNKEKIKEYYQNNKEKINEKRKIKIACDKCGSLIRKNDIPQHKKSKKCRNFVLVDKPLSFEV
jgi:transcriptional regulator of heat shock response